MVHDVNSGCSNSAQYSCFRWTTETLVYVKPCIRLYPYNVQMFSNIYIILRSSRTRDLRKYILWEFIPYIITTENQHWTNWYILKLALNRQWKSYRHNVCCNSRIIVMTKISSINQLPLILLISRFVHAWLYTSVCDCECERLVHRISCIHTLYHVFMY